MTEYYSSVVSFWQTPVAILSMALAVYYVVFAARNIVKHYLETGNIQGANLNCDFPDMWEDPYIFEGMMGGFLLLFLPTLLLMVWPVSATIAIITGIVAIPVRRKRQRIAFKQALQGSKEIA